MLLMESLLYLDWLVIFMVIVYVPCANEEEARKIGKALVEKKLAACANYFPINSIFEWKGKLEESGEVLLLIKTTDERWEAVKEEVKKMHSYEVPCIMKIDAEANKEYADWVNGQVK